ADDERGEQERRDDHLDQTQKKVSDWTEAHPDRRPQVADQHAHNQADENLGCDADSRLPPGVAGGSDFCRNHTSSFAPSSSRWRTNSATASTTDFCWPTVSSG